VRTVDGAPGCSSEIPWPRPSRRAADRPRARSARRRPRVETDRRPALLSFTDTKMRSARPRKRGVLFLTASRSTSRSHRGSLDTPPPRAARRCRLSARRAGSPSSRTCEHHSTNRHAVTRPGSRREPRRAASRISRPSNLACQATLAHAARRRASLAAPRARSARSTGPCRAVWKRTHQELSMYRRSRSHSRVCLHVTCRPPRSPRTSPTICAAEVPGRAGLSVGETLAFALDAAGCRSSVRRDADVLRWKFVAPTRALSVSKARGGRGRHHFAVRRGIV